MDDSKLEALKQANTWLTRKLQLTEEQIREGADVNLALVEENPTLREVSVSSNSK